ncbi:MAG: hypothetical protein JRH11_21885 [Deltaproteobacteria bacterium]|nr:hypothetical protein [Deltaproteobacteria bacterium]
MRSLTLLLVLLSAPSVLLAACTDSHDASDSGTRDSSLTDSSAGDSGAIDSGPDDGGPPPDYFACDYPIDCVVTANTCCGVCGRATADDVTSINGDRRDDYYADIACTEPVPCPACAEMPNPNLIAGCTGVSGMCSLIDIENDEEISGCSTNDDCIVRVPTCCACGADTSPHNLVAVSRDGLGVLLPQICDPRADCATCEPVYPDDVSAVCTEGLCRLVLP